MQVKVSPEVYYLMWELTHTYDQEWGGFVTADYKYNGYLLTEIYIRKLYIPKQKTSGVECDFETILIDDNGEFNNSKGDIISFPTGFFDATLADLMSMR